MNGLTPRSRALIRSARQPHYVYRCYDADDVLIYIGCTSDVRRRMTTHRAGRQLASRWLRVCMVRHEVVGPFPDRDSAKAAEAEAINAEQPVFNYQHRAGINLAAWMTRSPVGQYLVDHGHLELALETACTCWRETREAGGFDEWCVPHVALAESEAVA